MRKRQTFVLFLLFVVVLPGSSCDTNPEIESDTITLEWKVCEYDREQPFYLLDCGQIPNMEICVFGHSDIECGKTDKSGQFTLQGLPVYSELLLTFSHPDYRERLVPILTGNRNVIWDAPPRNTSLPGDIWWPPIIRKDTEGDPCPESEDTGEIAAIVLGFSFGEKPPLPDNESIYDDGSNLMTRPVAGATVEIVGSTEPIIYTNEFGKEPNPPLDSIVEGYALFCGLSKREYRVKFHVDGHFCVLADIMADRPVWGFRTETPNEIRVPVHPGARTVTAVKCYDTTNGIDDILCSDEDAGINDEDTGINNDY